jgi:hypothetical protein
VKRWFIATVFVMGCSATVDWKSLILSTVDIALPLIREAVSDGLSSMDASSGDASISDVNADRE